MCFHMNNHNNNQPHHASLCLIITAIASPAIANVESLRQYQEETTLLKTNKTTRPQPKLRR